MMFPSWQLTLSSDRYDHFTLRRIAAQVYDQIKQVVDVSEVKIIGGQRRQVRVILDSAKMAAYHIAPVAVIPILDQQNRQLASGSFSRDNREFLVDTGGFLHTAEEVGSVVVGAFNQRPVFLRDIAKIEDGPEEPADYVLMGKKGSPVSACRHTHCGQAERNQRHPGCGQGPQESRPG